MSYFKNGHVTYCEEIAPGEFEAVVEGTEDYEVRLTFRRNKLKEFSCTCPYDYGNICKHIVAVLYYLNNENDAAKGSCSKKGTVRNLIASLRKEYPQRTALLEELNRV